MSLSLHCPYAPRMQLTEMPYMQLAALEAAQEVDPVAQQIGAVNTLIRQPDGILKGFNTDWTAAISAIERGLQGSSHSSADASTSSDGQHTSSGQHAQQNGSSNSSRGSNHSKAESPLKGKTVVVIGAGGAGKALAFGAAQRGAKVVITNR